MKMLKWLKEVLVMFAKSKFASFLIEVFRGQTSKIIDKSYKFVNEYVQNVENIGEYIVTHPGIDEQLIKEHIKQTYGYNVTVEEIEAIDDDKGEGKYRLAYRLILDRLIQEGQDLAEAGLRQGINLAIEMAVSRFFGK